METNSLDNNPSDSKSKSTDSLTGSLTPVDKINSVNVVRDDFVLNIPVNESNIDNNLDENRQDASSNV